MSLATVWPSASSVAPHVGAWIEIGGVYVTE